MVPGVTGLILAGGRGRRMGGVDKGQQIFRGRPLVDHVIERLRPQVESLLISAASQAYDSYGWPVIADELGAGPLAGVHAGLGACETELVVTAPCDTPLLPDDLVQRLHAALQDADAAIAKVGTQRHNVCALVRRELRPRLEAFLKEGGRGVEAWYATLNTADVAFDDRPGAFANVNTLDELRRLQS
jgi:molybdopterin-guanine dinucleotide biosynthesis protein A